MTSAIAAQVRFYSNGKTHAQWQNFWVDKTVDGFVYVCFSSTDILMNRTADEGGITLSLPSLKDHLDFLVGAIEGEYLAEVKLYEKEVSSSLPSGFGGMQLVARFIGEVQGIQMGLTTMSVTLGAGIDAVNGEIPGRKMTTSLIGRLPTL